jgi:exosortase N
MSDTGNHSMQTKRFSLTTIYSAGSRGHSVLISSALIALVGALVAFPASYVSNLNVLLGFCLLPFSIFIHGLRRINWWYLMIVVVMAMLAFALNLRICYFFSLAFYFLFIIELAFGRVGHLTSFLILFMSPFFEQVAVIVGFPLRLQLSQCAGTLLSFAGLNIEVDGNAMLMNGTVFTVDEACMGLHMLSVSLLMGVFILAHRYRTLLRLLRPLALAGFFLVVLFLNALSNLFRIMMLVMFRILPGHVMHDVVGIVCLVLYIVVPLYFLSKWVVMRFGSPIPGNDMSRAISNVVGGAVAILGLTMLALGFHLSYYRENVVPRTARVELAGLKPKLMDDGITKLYNEEILVYVKPIPEFFTGEHTPLLCWKGSGYRFGAVRKSMIAGREVYVGALIKGDLHLNTAWWYDNGATETISQLDWRLRMLKGEPDFCLINVTAQDEQTLRENLVSIFEHQSLTIYE